MNFNREDLQECNVRKFSDKLDKWWVHIRVNIKMFLMKAMSECNWKVPWESVQDRRWVHSVCMLSCADIENFKGAIKVCGWFETELLVCLQEEGKLFACRLNEFGKRNARSTDSPSFESCLHYYQFAKVVRPPSDGEQVENNQRTCNFTENCARP